MKPTKSLHEAIYQLENCLYGTLTNDAIYYLKEYAEKKDELDEAIQKEKIEFLKASEVVRVCMENLNAIPRTVKVTDYTENVSGYEAEVGGKCGACGNWVYDELPYCPHCGKRLYWGEHE